MSFKLKSGGGISPNDFDMGNVGLYDLMLKAFCAKPKTKGLRG
jgi:hypothetical protein